VDLIQRIRAQAGKGLKRIALPESLDERTLGALPLIRAAASSIPVLVGDSEAISKRAHAIGVSLDGVEVVNPAEGDFATRAERIYLERQRSRGVTQDEARRAVLTPLTAACMLVKMGRADGVVAGAVHTTSDTVRAYLRSFGPEPGIRTVSSFLLMVTPRSEYGERGVFVYSDCGVVPCPDSVQLAEIALCAARSFQALVGGVPKVAFLSFSTRGSATDPSVEKVRRALEIFRARAPEVDADGEMQVDAALVPQVGASKAPGSRVAGQANVLIFPNLDAGNIAYKLTERLAQAVALGPMLQGLAAPANDLSRGCSPSDIADVCAITAVQAQAARPLGVRGEA
jgi:phosphate acetyltransferase